MLAEREYLRENAVTYARRWALDRNPLFADFSGIGGDCTNFVSQCVLAGSCEMNFTPTFGWFFLSETSRAPAWSGVREFYSFMTGAVDFRSVNGGVGPYAVEVGRNEILPGDVIQLADEAGDFYHTLIVTGFTDNGDITVCAHSDDHLDRLLSTYNYASLRYLHIPGVRVETGDDFCFERLMNG